MCRYFNTYRDGIFLFTFYLAACVLMLRNDVMLTGVDSRLAGWVGAEGQGGDVMTVYHRSFKKSCRIPCKNISSDNITYWIFSLLMHLSRLIWPMWSLCTSHEWRLSAFLSSSAAHSAAEEAVMDETTLRDAALSSPRESLPCSDDSCAERCAAIQPDVQQTVAVLHWKPSTSSPGH